MFGDVRLHEVIGPEPPAAELRRALAAELGRLTAELGAAGPGAAAGLGRRQAELHGMVNARPGAMAISQEKVRVYNGFSEEYMRRIGRAAGGAPRPDP